MRAGPLGPASGRTTDEGLGIRAWLRGQRLSGVVLAATDQGIFEYQPGTDSFALVPNSPVSAPSDGDDPEPAIGPPDLPLHFAGSFAGLTAEVLEGTSAEVLEIERGQVIVLPYQVPTARRREPTTSTPSCRTQSTLEPHRVC